MYSSNSGPVLSMYRERMAIITRTTSSTTTRTTIPVWLIKLLTVVICCVVLLLLYIQDDGIRSYYNKTFILIALTAGALLGWSIGSVLQQVFTIRNVEIAINVFLSALSIVCALLCLAYVFDTKDHSSSQRFKMMVGTAVCFIVQSIVCLLMLSWACYGNIVVVQRVN